jgi:KipI family sensor histidine kinase inhibitor
VRRFGDAAVVAEVDSVSEAHGLAASVAGAAWEGIEDVVVGYRSVTVIADPSLADLAALGEELSRIPARARDPATTRRTEIPVAFDGPDLEEVAALIGSSPATVVEQLTGTDLTVAFLGFLPGFAYLDGLPPALRDVPRRSSPRPVVGAGSLAIGGGFAGIYPQASPGGWQLLGHTGFELFDPSSPPFAALCPGDTVSLCAVADPGALSARSARAWARAAQRSDAACTAVVEAPGLLSMVEDLGRIGVAHLGVPRAGGADLFAVRAANRLVGNDDGAGALEITALGPRLRFDGPAHVAVVGRAEVTLDGRGVETDAVFPVAPGQVLSVGRTMDGLRCYLSVAGGLDVAPVLGSRSSDVLTSLGPGPLQAGDVLGLGTPSRPRGRMVRPDGDGSEGGGRHHVVRVVPGPDEVATGALERLSATSWEVGADSDRMGVRLLADTPVDSPTKGVVSRGMVTGAVQVPPDGQPLVLLCDHATVGGYPVVATVVCADVGILGRCRPGDGVRFEIVDWVDADRARARAERVLDRAIVGWYPVRSD